MAIDYTKSNTTRMTVTAAMAADFIARNISNRPMAEKRVRDYAEKMKRNDELRRKLHREPSDAELAKHGAWIFTHQGIGFDTRGVLVDGQHRLKAQVRAGVTLDWNVTTGLDQSAFDQTDVGDVRSAADLFSRRCPEAKNKSLVCAVARGMMCGMTRTNFERVEVVNFAEDHLTMISRYVDVLSKNALTKKASVIACFCNAVRPLNDSGPGPKGGRYDELVYISAERLATQSWLQRKDDPLKTLFQRFLSADRAALKSGVGIAPEQLYSLTLSAIRAEISGKGMQTAQGSEIDWGDPRDMIVTGTGDVAARKSLSQKMAWAEGRHRAVSSVVRRQSR